MFLRIAALFVAGAVGLKDLLFAGKASAQVSSAGQPLPDESVDATVKRLFGKRQLQPGAGRIKLELPFIAEDGGNVSVTIESDLPLDGATHLNHIYYIISDKNRRPMNIGGFFSALSALSASGLCMMAGLAVGAYLRFPRAIFKRRERARASRGVGAHFEHDSFYREVCWRKGVEDFLPLRRKDAK